MGQHLDPRIGLALFYEFAGALGARVVHNVDFGDLGPDAREDFQNLVFHPKAGNNNANSHLAGFRQRAPFP